MRERAPSAAGRHGAWPAVVAVLCYGLVPHQALAQATPEGAVLLPGTAVALALSSGDRRRVAAELGGGEFLRIRVRASGVDVSARLHGPDETLLAESSARLDEDKFLSLVAGVAGRHWVEVVVLDTEGAHGSSTIEIVEQRPSRPEDGSSVEADRLVAEADALRSQWQTDLNRKAIETYTASLQAWRGIGDVREQARARIRLADVYAAVGDSNEARRSAEAALALSRTAGSAELECASLNVLSRVAQLLGDTDRARVLGDEALSLGRESGNVACEAEALNNIGEVMAWRGRTRESLPVFERARAAATRAGVRRQLARSWLNSGDAHSDLSEADEALEAYTRALTVWTALDDSPQRGVTYNALARLHAKLGERQQALGYYLRAQDLFEKVGDPVGLGITFDGLGWVHLELGEPTIALEYYLRKLQVHEAAQFAAGAAGARTQIGHCYLAMGQHAKALEYLTTAVRVLERIEDRKVEAYARGLLGQVHEARSEMTEALASYERALMLAQGIGDTREEAYALNRTARLLQALGRDQEAFDRLAAARELSRGARDRVGEALTLFNTARLERDRGQLEAALALIRESLKLSESLRSDVASLMLRASYFASVRERHELHVDLLMALHVEHPDQGYDRLAFDASESARARSLLDGIADTRAGIREGADPQLLERERSVARSLNARAQRLAELRGSGADESEVTALGREIDALAAQRAAIDAQIRARSPRYAALTQPAPLDLDAVRQRVLDDRSRLLQYFVGEDQSYLWVVTRTDWRVLTLPGRAQLEPLVRGYRDQLALGREIRERDDRRTAAAAAALADLLLRPAGDLGPDRLLVVPDGILQGLPFAALPDSCHRRQDTTPPLVTEHEVIHLPSASTLALLRGDWKQERAALRSVMVFADPVFERDDPRLSSRHGSWRPPVPAAVPVALRSIGDLGLQESGLSRLLESRREARAIAALVPGATVALGFEATRAAAMSRDLASYRIVHFATHGLVDDEHPELSGVVLSQFDEEGRAVDGFLRLHDIYNLTLPVDLVVLSACSTALGKDVAGEGLVGLVRGFMYAGSRGVVASLWKVDDEATRELMTRFYRGMFERELPVSAALREAQLELLGMRRWNHPSYWAAFVLAGDWN